MKDEPITIYNHGDMYRDFTYVDDIVTGIENLLPIHPKMVLAGTLTESIILATARL